jgi:hypothetical protein
MKWNYKKLAGLGSARQGDVWRVLARLCKAGLGKAGQA